MALELKLGELFEGNYIATFSVDGTLVYIKDSTGDYDVDTNPGGYGAPNPERNTIGWVNLVQYKASTGDVEMTINSNNPISAIQIDVTLDLDGWIQVNGWLLPIIVGGEAEDTYAYDTSDGKVKQLQSSVWVEITDYTVLLSATGLITDVLNIPVLVASSKKQLDVNNERFDKILTGEYNETRELNDRLYNEIDGRIEQSSSQFTTGNYSEFQRIIEALNKFIAQYGV